MLRSHTFRWVSLLAVFVLGMVAAAVVSLGPWSRKTQERASSIEASSLAATMGSQVESIEHQVADLMRRIEQLEANRLDVREPLVPQPADAAVQSDDALDALAKRVARLERLATAPEQQVARREDARPPASQERANEDRIEADHDTIRDGYLSDLDKANAWLDLAQQDVYPWTDDIIAAMTSIGLSSENDRAREVVWIGAEGQFRSELLVQPLIAALADPIAAVREEAADALSQYLDMPGVQNALGWTSNYDESEDVRNEATKALRGEE